MEPEMNGKTQESERIDQYFARAVEMFPDVDLEFLRLKSVVFAVDTNAFDIFIENTMLKNDYPKMETANSQPSNEEKKDWRIFSVESFVEKFPDPENYFLQSKKGKEYISHSMSFLHDRFRYCPSTMIKCVLEQFDFNLYRSFKELEQLAKFEKKNTVRPMNIADVSAKPPLTFFDEVNFIINEDIILQHQKDKLLAREAAMEEARKANALLTCGCCFSDDLLGEEVVTCSEGHIFCRDCTKKSTEILLGQAKVDFPCLEGCGAFFQVSALKDVLPKGSYEKLLKKIQEREVAEACIQGIENCPFCEYSVIPDEANRIFDCLNCRRSSCRLCRKESHIPFKCHELEDCTIRKYVEEKMSEALIRNCYKCGAKFIRENGCNKMTCPCGALMCYICRKPIEGYSHFDENDIVRCNGRCPLWVSNNELHINEVNKEADRAIQEVKSKNPQIDTDDLNKLKN